MQVFTQLDHIKNYLNEQGIKLLYVRSRHCSTCHALQPKVAQLASGFSYIQTAQVWADEMPELASLLHILSAPMILLFADGKEIYREGRFVQMQDLRHIFEQSEHYLMAEQPSFEQIFSEKSA